MGVTLLIQTVVFLSISHSDAIQGTATDGGRATEVIFLESIQ